LIALFCQFLTKKIEVNNKIEVMTSLRVMKMFCSSILVFGRITIHFWKKRAW